MDGRQRAPGCCCFEKINSPKSLKILGKTSRGFFLAKIFFLSNIVAFIFNYVMIKISKRKRI